MEKEQYKNIIGIDNFWKYFPDKPWFYFHDILEFKYYKEFDYEEWRDRWYLDLKMTDLDGKDIVVFKLVDVYGEGTFQFQGYISGLNIVNLRHTATWLEPQYELLDFEDSSIHFYCSDIEVSVLMVNGKEV